MRSTTTAMVWRCVLHEGNGGADGLFADEGHGGAEVPGEVVAGGIAEDVEDFDEAEDFGGAAAEDGEAGDVVVADEGAETVHAEGGGDADDAGPGIMTSRMVMRVMRRAALDEVLFGWRA